MGYNGDVLFAERVNMSQPDTLETSTHQIKEPALFERAEQLLQIAQYQINSLSDLSFQAAFEDKFVPGGEGAKQLEFWVQQALKATQIIIRHHLQEQALALQEAQATRLAEFTSVSNSELSNFKATVEALLEAVTWVFDRCPRLRLNLAPFVSALMILATLAPMLATAAPPSTRAATSETTSHPNIAQLAENNTLVPELNMTLREGFLGEFSPAEPTASFAQTSIINAPTNHVTPQVESTPAAPEQVRLPNLRLETDPKIIAQIQDYLDRSPVATLDFSSPELASLPPDFQNALAATNVAIVDLSRSDYLFPHGSLIRTVQGKTALVTVAHVVMNHLYRWDEDQAIFNPSNSLFLVVQHPKETRIYHFQPQTREVIMSTDGYEDGLAIILVQNQTHLWINAGQFLPTIPTITYDDYKQRGMTEGQSGRAFLFTSTGGLNQLAARQYIAMPNIGITNSWASIPIGAIPDDPNKPSTPTPISTNGDSGRGLITKLDGKYLCVGINRGAVSHVDEDSFFNHLAGLTTSYPFNFDLDELLVKK